MSIAKNIFLIDDDTDDQEFFIKAISGLKNISLSGVANNGAEALNLLNHCTLLPDFVFLDFDMPLMNGIECLREIKKFSRTKDIPVIMLSSAIEQAESSREFGAKGFIKKFDDITAFRKELHKVINLGITVNYIITDQTKSPSFIKTDHEKKS
jgi:CheY-like chemotaxis protein